jgi:cytidylate kinase
MPTITVTRMFGSGGSEVARRVAETLGWRLVDSAFVDGIAKGLRATPSEVRAIDERAPSLAERLADALALGSGEVQSASLATPMPPTEQKIAEVTREVIEKAVARGPSVVVGRGAQAFLAQRDDVLHVHCYAPHDALVERTMKREGISEEEADRMVKAKNQQREAYVKRMFGRAWLAPEHYHIMLNTAWLGQDKCVELVLELAHERFGTQRNSRGQSR